MKQIARHLCLLITLAGPVAAEDILQLGLKNAVSFLTPVPEETAREAQATAARLLGRYVKKQGENYLCQYSSAVMANNWTELNGLKLSGVTYQSVSDADKANGIQEKLFVTVDCGLYRTRKPGDSSWSPWVNGRPVFMPGAIYIEHGMNGQWTASESTLKYFNPIGNARPTTNPVPGGLPTGMNHSVARTSPPLPPATPPAQNTSGPAFHITTVPSATVQPPPTSSAPVLTGTFPSPPPTGNSEIADTLTKPFKQVIPLLIGVLVVASIIPQVLKKSKRSSARRPHSRRGNPQGPPPLPKTGPPALSGQPPCGASSTVGNPLHLIQCSENLLTPAELAFFAVLEPLIHSSYRISAKVRLADLFNAVNGPGWQTAFNKISRKHIDFVVTDSATSRILCGIELDDSSHQRPERIERDQFVNEVFERNQLPLLRIPFSYTYYAAGLRAELAKAGLSRMTGP